MPDPITQVHRLAGKLGRRPKQALLSLAPTGLSRWYERRLVDTFVISFPKCGRTWVRLMLTKALQLHLGLPDPPVEVLLYPGKLADIDPSLPRALFTHDDNPQLKTPAEIERDKAHYAAKRVVFLVRDPRDVVVSMYFQNTRRKDRFEGTLKEFVHQDRGSIDSIVTFYNVWHAERDRVGGFLLVRYEDLRQDPGRELARALEFLGYPSVSAEVLQEAVEFASFDNMRLLEMAGSAGTGEHLRPGDPADAESFKTRRGKVGGYRDYLDHDDLALIESSLRHLVADYGYTEPR